MTGENQRVLDKVLGIGLGLLGLLFLETQCAKGSEFPSPLLGETGGDGISPGPSGGTATAPAGGTNSTGTGGNSSGGGDGAGGTPGTGGQAADGGNDYCATYTDLGVKADTGSIGTTGEICFRSSTPSKITNFQVNSCNGRTVTINGEPITCPATGNGECTGPFPSMTSDGHWYIDVSAGSTGSVAWCSVGWWCTTCN